MSSLQEVVVTPNPALAARSYSTFDEDDDDNSDLDEGDRALLSNAQSSPRWLEKTSESAWSTAKGTALEVRHRTLILRASLTFGIDTTYFVVHDGRYHAYWRAIGPCVGESSIR